MLGNLRLQEELLSQLNIAILGNARLGVRAALFITYICIPARMLRGFSRIIEQNKQIRGASSGKKPYAAYKVLKVLLDLQLLALQVAQGVQVLGV